MIEIFTLGCRLNQYDSARLKAVLENTGEDLIVLNTCAVTAKASSEARKVLRRLKRENQKSKIAVVGCAVKYSENPEVDFKEADFIAKDGKELVKILGRVSIKEEIIPDFSGRTRAFLKIQEGCDRKCSYCVVPFVRGKSLSRTMCEIEKEMDSLLLKGYKEIVITGTNISDYGKDLSNKVSLKDVIKMVLGKSGNYRIRLSSVENSAIDEELINLMKESGDKLCKHLHIPIQSCSPKVLRSMKRLLDVDKLEEKLNRIVSEIPLVGIGCDILVAFPTEGEKEFEETVQFIERSPISFFHIFTFSRRAHTEAQNMKPLPDPVVKERKKILLNLAMKKKREFLKRNEGKTLRALTLENSTALSSNFIEFKICENYSPNVFGNFVLKLNKSGDPFGESV